MASQRSRDAAMLFLSPLEKAVKHVCRERRVTGRQRRVFWCVWRPSLELLEAAVGSVGESEHRRCVGCLRACLCLLTVITN